MFAIVSPEGSVSVEAVNMSVLFDPNEAATLNCMARGGPNNTFLWFFDGRAIERATTDVLSLSQVEGGEYTCQVSNAAGSEDATIVLTGQRTIKLYY
jgi:membrane carboxypeptidase/penicillin-binding protein PbpC